MAAESLLDEIDDLLARIDNYQIQPEHQILPSENEMTIDERIELITSGLAEVMNPEVSDQKMREILRERPLRIYWGTATTGAPHIAYFIPLTQLGQFLKAGCEVVILLADIHSVLDAGKTPWELTNARVAYYKAIITTMLRAVNVPVERLTFVRGSDFQLSKDYTLDVYKLCAATSLREAKKAGAEVVKQEENPKLAPILYPLLQALDEEYLKVDAQFGGVDQRKIFAYASDFLKKVCNYESRIHLMNPICPGLNGPKMSSSEGGKIDCLESAKQVKKKINAAHCVEAEVIVTNPKTGETSLNGILAFNKFVVYPCFLDGEPLIMERKEQEPLTLPTYQDLEDAFGAGLIHPKDLKDSTAGHINRVLDFCRAEFQKPEMAGLRAAAYPPKKETKVKISGVEDLNEHEQWIFNHHQSFSTLPTVKEIRLATGLSKRFAKRSLMSIRASKVLDFLPSNSEINYDD